jgi:hypothetical protein
VSDEQTHYGLARPILNSNLFLPIDASEYLWLSRPKEFLLEVLAFEENLDVLLGNYLDLEKAFNDLATEYIVRLDYGHQSRSDSRVLANRLIQNLPAACRLYLDHGAHHAGEMVNSYVFADSARLVQIRAVALPR